MSNIRLCFSRPALEAAIDRIIQDAEADLDARPWDIESARAWHCAYLRGMQRLFIFGEGPGYEEGRALIQAGIEAIEAQARKRLDDAISLQSLRDARSLSLAEFTEAPVS